MGKTLSSTTDAKPLKPAKETPTEGALEISFDDQQEAKPLKKKPALSSQKKAVKKLDEDKDETPNVTPAKGESESAEDSTSLDFSFGDEEAAKPRKKRPVLSSQKNPPKRRSKKPENEGGEEETESKSSPPEKVSNTNG